MEPFRTSLDELRPEVDAALERHLPGCDVHPGTLHEAMRYAVFAGGKRVRPALLILVGELYDAPRERLLPAAAAPVLLTKSDFLYHLRRQLYFVQA